MTRIEAHLSFSTAVHALESPSWPAGVVPNPFKDPPTPYQWDIDYIHVIIDGSVENPKFTNVVALQVMRALVDWTQLQARQIGMQAVVVSQEGSGVLGVVAAAITPERPTIA